MLILETRRWMRLPIPCPRRVPFDSADAWAAAMRAEGATLATLDAHIVRCAHALKGAATRRERRAAQRAIGAAQDSQRVKNEVLDALSAQA